MFGTKLNTKQGEALHFVLWAYARSNPEGVIIDKNCIMASDGVSLHRAKVDHDWPVGRYDVMDFNENISRMVSKDVPKDAVSQYDGYFPKTIKRYFLTDHRLDRHSVVYTLAQQHILIEGERLLPMERIGTSWTVSFIDSNQSVYVFSKDRTLEALIKPGEPQRMNVINRTVSVEPTWL